ncbi:PilX N-terminal domain-containing pilus assembly protein [Motiliproteus sp. SC1-56]|uniref:pilus assembly PilX family protein n=1 Tax=Motiliproteus sp. SC1-56 TaxID=2799565 RepID=UPI001A8F8233|nr:pilus assembly PilX N-terminal domain-containing protein [Motiliproteus sp. SC1-56]
MRMPEKNAAYGRERGMVLVVCLLVILMVTLIAATATRTSTFEEKMAANAQTYNRTFQAAESAVEVAINNDNLMFEAIDDVSTATSSQQSVPIGDSGVTASAQIEFKGEGIAPGNSIGSASTYMYEIHAIGSMDSMNATTEIRQGFYRVSFVGSSDG